MCGIAGIFNAHADETVPPALLDRLVDALAHRGPDDRGCVVLGPIGLGARRLSIVDVEGGRQPMATSDRLVHLVYNGEVYNHAELRRQLEGLGHRFRTRCDTEVVLLGYRQWGIRGLAERLNGIFAFAIWDAGTRVGHLCRDRLGVKPLYYTDRNGRLVFSSELRSLAGCGLLTPRVDDVALWGYLTYQFTPDDRTLLAGARKLAPGHVLTWRDGHVSRERYWDLPVGGEMAPGRLAEHAEQVGALLADGIERQMMSDVPIGCFLSGGLDSTIIACSMARLGSSPPRTYSISFPGDPSCDESDHFERIAHEIGATHTTVEFSEAHVLENLERFAWAADEPVADPAMLPTWLLARTAARDVKVVLTGEGADEVFAGYPYYRPLATAPRSPTFSRAQPVRGATGDPRHPTGNGVPVPRIDRVSRISGFPYALDARFLWHLLQPDHRPEIGRLETLAERTETTALEGLDGLSPLQAALAVDTKLWLANDLMPKLDKATMAHSLEGRVPFLDHRLVELAFRLPASVKVGAEHGKLVLREAVRGIVPEASRWRRKQGFNVPLGGWLRSSLLELLRDTLLGSSFRDMGLFQPRVVEALIAGHAESRHDLARPLWQLLCLSLWLHRLRHEMEPHDPIARPLELRATRSPPARREEPVCDLVIPVYEGVSYVRDLLRSIERNTELGTCRALLIDDSANEATHAALSDLVRDRSWASLHRNDGNLGFVASCNRGIALGSAPYVCLLNSDTLVGEGWLARMLDAAGSADSVAVVNPISNQAVNISVPMPPGYDVNSMARKLREISRRRYPDLTTAVGFCMLLKRHHVAWLGAFDPIYGHGYLEESDLCMRYTEAGLRVVAADDAFVYHRGCGSFGTWLERYRRNRVVFDARWNDEYQRDYARFLERNPLQYLRDALLRHTLGKAHWSAMLARVLEGDVARRRLKTAARLAASPALGARTAWSLANRAGRSVAAWAKASARPRTLPDPEQRTVRYPTAAYVDGIPVQGRPSVTFLVAAMPLCGGIVSIVQLAREFLLQGLNVRIATLTEELQPERFNLPLQPLVYPDRETLVRLLPKSDVVVATYWTTAFDYLPELRRRYDFLSVYLVQDYEAYFYPEADVATRTRVVSTYGMAERRIVKSQWLRGLIEGRHGWACEVVPLGLDLGIFRDRGLRARGGPPRIVAAARPHERRRGFAELVEAMRIIRRRRPDAELVLFGTPEEEMPRGLDLPYTNVGPLSDQNKVAELLASCDVLIDASIHQAFGRPGLEAMACGTSCVLTSEGGVNSYARHEENCLLVRPEDPAAIAHATLRLLDDPSLGRRLRHEGRRTAQRFSHVEEARRHLELYREWLGERETAAAAAAFRRRGSREELAAERRDGAVGLADLSRPVG